VGVGLSCPISHTVLSQIRLFGYHLPLNPLPYLLDVVKWDIAGKMEKKLLLTW